MTLARLYSVLAAALLVIALVPACAENREPETPAGPPPTPCSSQKECPRGTCVMDPCFVSPCTVGHCKD